MRLNRYLSVCGYTSRRKAEMAIRAGHVKVNGFIVTDPAATVDPERDTVTIDGVTFVITTQRRYYVMNKPIGVIVSRGDTHERVTVYDLLGPETRGVVSAGRLDAYTSGVLIFSDDGKMVHRLTHPSFGVEKVYCAEVEGKVGKEDVQRLKEGLILNDGLTAPVNMKICQSWDDCSIVEVAMHEGRKRQVRRMLAHIGHPVRMLERISFGCVTLKNIPLGEYRDLSIGEIECLKKMVDLL